MTFFKKFATRIGGFGIVVLQYSCIAHCTFEYVGNIVTCSGPSMQPTVNSNDVLLTEHISVARRSIKIGDVVICRSPSDPSSFICKRVKGLEGDFVSSAASSSWKKRVVPMGHVWLEGDNAGNSTDSRSYGPVPYGLIRSRAVFKIWPIKDIQRLRAKPADE